MVRKVDEWWDKDIVRWDRRRNDRMWNGERYNNISGVMTSGLMSRHMSSKSQILHERDVELIAACWNRRQPWWWTTISNQRRIVMHYDTLKVYCVTFSIIGSSDGFDCLIFLSLLIMLVCFLSWGAWRQRGNVVCRDTVREAAVRLIMYRRIKLHYIGQYSMVLYCGTQNQLCSWNDKK